MVQQAQPTQQEQIEQGVRERLARWLWQRRRALKQELGPIERELHVSYACAHCGHTEFAVLVDGKPARE